MNYIRTTDGAYPITESQIRADHPNTSFAVPFVAPDEYAFVFPSPAPSYDTITQTVREIDPVLTDKGHYEQAWIVTDKTQEQLDAEAEAKRIAAVPVAVSPRQIRQALTRAGLREKVEAAIAAGDQDTKDWYEFATTFERQNQHVIDMGIALGQTERQLDDLFTLAASL
jgi:hypothetical protein